MTLLLHYLMFTKYTKPTALIMYSKPLQSFIRGGTFYIAQTQNKKAAWIGLVGPEKERLIH